MIALRPYPAYRDSGVAWLGELPEHWEARRLKSVMRNVVDSTRSLSPRQLYLALENVEGWTGRIRAVDQRPIFDGQVKRFRAGDILFGKLRPYLAKVTRPDRDGGCVGEFLVLRPSEDGVIPRYMELLLRSKPIIDVVDSSTFGAKMPRADWVYMGGLPICLPPPAEQTAIARFLDDAHRRISRYIRAKEQLVELLEEQKQAIIHQAVTGQIDVRTGQPYPAYRDSGVEWLGEVPEHWKIRRNGGLFTERSETGFGSLPILEVSIHEKVRIRDMQCGSRKQRIEEKDRYKRAKKGDITYNTMRMWQGAVGVVPADGLVSPAYVVMSPVDGVMSSYYGYLFRMNAYKGVVKGFSRGIVSDRDRLYWDDFKRIPSIHPPIEEQAGITRFLGSAERRISARRGTIKRQIELLHEYRTRLISDVVTGKLEMRGAAARLPEVDPIASGNSRDRIQAPSNPPRARRGVAKEAIS